MPHREVHLPHELMEGRHTPAPSGPSGFERILEMGAVVLLSVTVVITAWSGYQAARWAGDQSRLYTEASAHRVKSAQQSTLAGQARIDDLLYFNGWLDAHEAGDERLAAVYRRRFRPEFRPAYRAWIAQRPFTNPKAVPGPLYMPQYKPAALGRAQELDAEAEALYREGIKAKQHDDDYILSTVFFATVLFFASISLRLEWRPLRIIVFGLATTLLVGGTIFVLSLPIA
jgi:hypothetical protein